MAEFLKALPTVLFHEGLLEDNPADPGKITNFGISLQWLKQTGALSPEDFKTCDINHDGTINAQDIKSLTKEDVQNLYKMYWWDKSDYDKIADQDIATKIFDLAVNMGTHAAVLCAQRAVRAAIGLQLVLDGRLAFGTVTALNMCDPKILMAAIKSESAGYYRGIKSSAAAEFINGWLKRAYDEPVKEPS